MHNLILKPFLYIYLLKKAIAILFLSSYLFSTTQLRELLKLPLLIQHYIEHKAENNNITFLGFLDMHYAHGDVKDADYDKDMKLPFKTITLNTVALVYCYQPNSTFSCIKQIFTTLSKQKFPTTSVHFSSSHLDAIWQPPRSV
jgi:hypothetical protein